jgi:periplasmic protein CpxP/Spy
MTKRSKTALGIGSLAAGFLLLTGFSGCSHHHRPDPATMDRRIARHLDAAFDDLKATPEQRTRLTAIKDRLVAEARAAHGDHRADAKLLLAEWESGSPDAARLHALVDARIDAIRAMAHRAVDTGVEVHGILTPEQRAQVAKKARRHLED